MIGFGSPLAALDSPFSAPAAAVRYGILLIEILRFESGHAKAKDHKGTKKRFRLTATGKVKHRSAGTSHLASRKTQKRMRQLRGTVVHRHGLGKAIDKALAGNSY